MDKTNYIAENLKAVRLSKKMTQPEMSKILYIHYNSLLEYESGRRAVPLDIAIKLTELTGKTLDELVFTKIEF